MRILLCTSETGNDAGGLALHCSQLKEIYEELGHEVFVEVLLNPHSYYVIDGGYDSELGNKLRTSYMLRSIEKKYSDRIDLCVSCGGGRTAYYSMLICAERKIPLYIVLCGSEVNLSYEQPMLAFYNTQAMNYSSAIIGLSNELNSNAKKFNNNPSCMYYVIPNYCELGNEIKEHLSLTDKHRITFASGAAFLGEKKGIANLLKAFSILIHEKGRDDRLYLFGKIDDDIKQKYQQIIHDLSLERNVFLCGYLERNAFHEKMMSVDTYLQASPFEGFGNSVVEALSLGKDILISDTGYIAESIGKDYKDHIMQSLDPNDMANDMYNYCTNVVIKGDADKIRFKLLEELRKENVINLWRQVFGQSKRSTINVGADSCFAVMFHDVNSDYSGIDYAPDGFNKLINSIYERGLRLCSVHDFFLSPDSSKNIICTFDDGYESVFKNAFPIMKQYGFTATVYMCPDLIGKDNSWNHKDSVVRKHMTGEMITTLCEYGWEIGSHGLSHINL